MLSRKEKAFLQLNYRPIRSFGSGGGGDSLEVAEAAASVVRNRPGKFRKFNAKMKDFPKHCKNFGVTPQGNTSVDTMVFPSTPTQHQPTPKQCSLVILCKTCIMGVKIRT
jgi:hypothetical protein